MLKTMQIPWYTKLKSVERTLKVKAIQLWLKEVEEAKDKLKKSIEAGNIEDIKKIVKLWNNHYIN